MKKLIAVAVVFALVAGGLFAADISIDVRGTVDLVKGKTVEAPQTPVLTGGAGDNGIGTDGFYIAYKDSLGFIGDRMTGGMNMHRLRMGAAGGDDVFGGWFRWEGGASGFAWWKPIDQLKILIGGNPDGFYDNWGGAGWGFYQIAGDMGMAFEKWNYGAAYYGGDGGNALRLEITPMDMLAINVMLPYAGGKNTPNGDLEDDIFANMHLQANMNFDFGKVGITYVNANTKPSKFNNGGGAKVLGEATPSSGTKQKVAVTLPKGLQDDTSDNNAVSQKVYLFVGLSMIDNLDLDLSVGMGMPQSKSTKMLTKNVDVYDDGSVFADLTQENTYTVNPPIAVGLSAKYSADAFGVKARLMAQFAGSASYEGKSTYAGLGSVTVTGSGNDPFSLSFDVMPYYAVNDNVTVFLAAGLQIVDGRDVVMQQRAKFGETLPAAAADNPNRLSTKKADAAVDFHVEPYVRVGGEWGPSFYMGFRLWTSHYSWGDDDKNANWVKDPGEIKEGDTLTSPNWYNDGNGSKIIYWSVPMGINVAF